MKPELDEKRKSDVHLSEETSDQLVAESTVAAEFAERRRKQQVAMIPLGLAMIFVLLGDRLPGDLFESVFRDQVFAFVVIVVLVFFGYSLVNWRCPSCNRYLGQRLSPKKCPHCGAVLQDEIA